MSSLSALYPSFSNEFPVCVPMCFFLRFTVLPLLFCSLSVHPCVTPTVTDLQLDMSLFWSYVTQRYSHRREGLPRSVGVGLREVGEINLDFIINKSCLPVPSFFRCFFFRRRLCNLPVKATFCIAEWIFQSSLFHGLELEFEISLKRHSPQKPGCKW